ncbi:hypothetical protein MPTK1_6g05340 [Marchantia polymorpha subsp. ruderalis]|uniref:Uncharacterized protein n=2 Tax=Marchantia polymorpha TaxID=3197 RepID=A0AAF6BNS1_MARPO|nr:hypothetical protein MARPO_0167s0017 [Marchantia polymorpha]BBN13655.1 hypothetical protein Mp_6g05340 [Marchantia polymorpha subsp. ruderalis]|eukprot:PTQ28325.1 hypothetical protein MARPO_0167s0017 [Marchantia polymorpha]
MPSTVLRKRFHGHPVWRWRIGVLLIMGTLALLTMTKFQGDVTPTHESEFIALPEKVPLAKPKLAFLYLARNQMPLDILWAHFFKGAEEHEYNVYIHARPGVVYNRKTTDCKAFYNRQIKNSVSVEWGAASMVEAERLLLATALEDPLNERFILLSDSCVPLYTFKYVYDYVMSSHKSFVDSFIDYADERYDPRMAPQITSDKWRKGSQWFFFIRKHAEAVVNDTVIFPVFRQYCKRLALPEYWRARFNNETEEEHNCIPDEHYIQTLLAIKDLEEEIERRTLTYSHWKDFDQERDRRGWHPITFNYADASLKTIKDIQAIISIHYATESRTEWCSSNGEPRPCYLFARKFTRGAGFRLLNQVKQYENPQTIEPQPS